MLLKWKWAPTPMQITWPWPSVGRMTHDLITSRQKSKHEHKVVRLVWDFDCLHFAQHFNRSHGIDCKQTWCKKIYHMNRVSWLNPLTYLLMWTSQFTTTSQVMNMRYLLHINAFYLFVKVKLSWALVLLLLQPIIYL